MHQSGGSICSVSDHYPIRLRCAMAFSRGMERLSVALRIRFAEKSRINGSLHLQGPVREDPYCSHPPFLIQKLRKKRPRALGFKWHTEDISPNRSLRTFSAACKTILFTRTHAARQHLPPIRLVRAIKGEIAFTETSSLPSFAQKFYERYINIYLHIYSFADAAVQTQASICYTYCIEDYHFFNSI